MYNLCMKKVFNVYVQGTHIQSTGKYKEQISRSHSTFGVAEIFARKHCIAILWCIYYWIGTTCTRLPNIEEEKKTNRAKEFHGTCVMRITE